MNTNRLDFVKNNYLAFVNKMKKKGYLVDNTISKGETHPAWLQFINEQGDSWGLPGADASLDGLFDLFILVDPTPKKKYVQWFVKLFKYLHTEALNTIYICEKDGRDTPNVYGIGSNMYLFFEDILKLSDSIETYEYLKLTKILKVDEKQINQVYDYKELIDLVQPYQARIDESDKDIHTLDHKELKLLQDPTQATIFADTLNYICVITHTKAANKEFGKYTNWCTASTRYGSMFDTYSKQGPLFVLIRKGKGNKASVTSAPENRLQFHFQSEQYMNAKDRRIDVSDFFYQNPDLKLVFKDYIQNEYMRGIKKVSEKIIKFLLNLGYADIMVDMIAISKPKTLSLSGYSIHAEHLGNLCKIPSLEYLDLSDTKLRSIPESIKTLKNLTTLKLNGNPIINIPNWINELTNLRVLELRGCNLKHGFLANKLNKLETLILDYNENLKTLPQGLEYSNLKRLTMSYTAVKRIDFNNAVFPNLVFLDVHDCQNLEHIDINLLECQQLMVFNCAQTKIPKEFPRYIDDNHPNRSLGVIYFLRLKDRDSEVMYV